jgi:hypothetical protein
MTERLRFCFCAFFRFASPLLALFIKCNSSRHDEQLYVYTLGMMFTVVRREKKGFKEEWRGVESLLLRLGEEVRYQLQIQVHCMIHVVSAFVRSATRERVTRSELTSSSISA